MTTSNRTPITLILIAGILALLVGIGIGVQSDSTGTATATISCGSQYFPNKSLNDQAEVQALIHGEATQQTIVDACSHIGSLRTLAWLLTIVGTLAVLGVLVALVLGRPSRT